LADENFHKKNKKIFLGKGKEIKGSGFKINPNIPSDPSFKPKLSPSILSRRIPLQILTHPYIKMVLPTISPVVICRLKAGPISQIGKAFPIPSGES
jgi:hypothetical protein